MDVILDQRQMLGGQTVAEIESIWVAKLAQKNVEREARHLAPLVFHPMGTAGAYVNHGRWLADCVCGGGAACWVENPDAACLDCGSVYDVAWPDASTRAEAERILVSRPDPRTRNWYPWSETTEVLLAENHFIGGLA